jgi:hypothetical protein
LYRSCGRGDNPPHPAAARPQRGRLRLVFVCTVAMLFCTACSGNEEVKPDADRGKKLVPVTWQVGREWRDWPDGDTEVHDPKRLQVYAFAGREPCKATARETDHQVAISVRCAGNDAKFGCSGSEGSCTVPPAVSVHLKRAVGDRSVIDGLSGESRKVCPWPTTPDPEDLDLCRKGG